ncbi:MAG: CcmD family protein [Bacteroidia bacterium]|nr:CcmD family protein [Bacteroidia bacterium]
MTKRQIYRFLCSIVLLGIPNFVLAADIEETMYSEGKIYVVVAVLSLIFAGITIYLIMLDKKISKIEKDSKQK